MRAASYSAYSGDSAKDSHLFGRTAKETKKYCSFPAHFYREVTMENKSTTETYEDRRQKAAVFNLTSDQFA